MPIKDEHLFWAARWTNARSMCRQSRFLSNGSPDEAMRFYAIYLTEVFSWYFDNWQLTEDHGTYN